MRSKNKSPFTGFYLASLVILAFCLLGLPQCNFERASHEEHYVSIKLNDSLKKYDSVEVLILAESDTSKIIGKAWNGPLPNPMAIPDFRLADNETRNLSIQVRGYDFHGLLMLNMMISKADGKQVIVNTPINLAPVNLVALKTSIGTMTPDFTPEQTEYMLKLAEAESSFTVTAVANNAYSNMAIGLDSLISGVPSRPFAPDTGTTIITLHIGMKNLSRDYKITINRAGKPTAKPSDSTSSGPIKAELIALKSTKGILSPAFSKEQRIYSLTLQYAESTLSVYAVPEKLGSKISIGSILLAPALPSSPIFIPQGENSIGIQVTIGNSTSVYQIRTLRSSLAPGIGLQDKKYPNKTTFANFDSYNHQAIIKLNLAPLGFESGIKIKDFPILLRLNNESFNFEQFHNNGADIRFSDLNGEPLKYENVRWDSLAQIAEIWIKLDSIQTDGANSKFYMYWGNSDRETDSKSEDVFTVNAGFNAVYHLSENIRSSGDEIKDATGRFPGRAGGNGSGLPKRIAGVVGNGLDFFANSTQGNIILPNAFDPGPTEWTFQAWIKKSGPEEGVVFYKGNLWQPTDQRFQITVKGGYENHIDVNRDGSIATSDVYISESPFTFVSVVYNGSKVDFYADGYYRMSRPWTQGTKSLGSAILGSHTTNGELLGFHGSMDEVWFSSNARSPEWIRLNYETQKPNSNILQIESVP